MKSLARLPSTGTLPPANRSRITNGSALILFGDGRSAGARRFRDVLCGLADELGGLEGLTESETQVVRRAASTAVECEALEALKAAGEPVASDTFTSILNASRRALKDFEVLRRRHQASKPKPTKLHSFLASRREGAGEPQPV